MTDFTDLEKLTTVDVLITHWRSGRLSPILNGRRTLLILKEIADDIRGRDPKQATKTLLLLDREITNARKARDRTSTGGYPLGNIKAVGEITIGRWPSIREALERFGKEERK